MEYRMFNRKISIYYAEYDRWVGRFIDRKNNINYICIIPRIVVKIESLEAKWTKSN